LVVGQAVPSELAGAAVLDRAETKRALATLWAESPAIIVFLRHFGCVGCAEHVTELSPRLSELHALGVRTALVGNGPPHFIEGFVERHGLGDKPVEVFTDPSLKSFAAAGLRRSVWATSGAQALFNYARGRIRGFSNTIRGDRYQQGGVLVVDGEGTAAYLHRDRHLGDHPPTVDVVGAALRLAAAQSALP
jgi:hypothetical protein